MQLEKAGKQVSLKAGKNARNILQVILELNLKNLKNYIKQKHIYLQKALIMQQMMI